DVVDLDTEAKHLRTTAGATAADQATVAGNLLGEILAHEIDHARDGPGENNHKDPPQPKKLGQASVPEPAVDDENNVMSELGTGVTRMSYVAITRGGTKNIPWKIAGSQGIVSLLLTSFLNEIRVVEKFAPTTPFTVDPSDVAAIPGTICAGVPGEEP